jgi:hypothetical protein
MSPFLIRSAGNRLPTIGSTEPLTPYGIYILPLLGGGNVCPENLSSIDVSEGKYRELSHRVVHGLGDCFKTEANTLTQ